MLKASLFDIETKKDHQIAEEMKMSAIERLYLTLDLMDLSLSLSQQTTLQQNQDDLNWITLKFVDAKQNP
jgi:hypothetical protein